MAEKKKVTSSATRSKRSSKQPVTKGQNPYRANRQAVSQAKVTRGGKPQGARSYKTQMRAPVTSDATRRTDGKGAARVTQGAGQTVRQAANVMKTAAQVRSLATPAGVAAAVMAPRPAGNATMKGKPTSNPQGPAVPKRLTQAGLDKGSFDNAFRQSRKAGKKEFTWRGKRYNTKLRGE